ncbi:hypothetical protein M9H77_18241 [Catharanthus roseus]|uniref:Uncharacterized protein n=1 Tax=Catharanthus roseus TaxID=4058 RepID=A0ACC0B6W8_CATRO|nr:hypothetical protein M9H77_18241 [Catharanthus roseus]
MHDNQREYDNFSSHARSYEHNFYDCYEGNRFGTRNDYNDTSYKRVPRNDVRNGGTYVNMDERFHKRKCDYEGYHESYNYGGRRIEAKAIKSWSLMKQTLRDRFGVENREEQRQVQPKVKFKVSLMVEEFPRTKSFHKQILKKVLKSMLRKKYLMRILVIT